MRGLVTARVRDAYGIEGETISEIVAPRVGARARHPGARSREGVGCGVLSWIDLDKLAVAKPRADGTATLVVRDDRSRDRMLETKHLSIVVAISRVARARHALAERYASRGAIVYVTSSTPPAFVVDAVTAAGGVVFDGAREHVARSPLATTMQLDAAFCDLASVVRRRLDARTFGDALDTLERDLRRERPERTDVAAWWTAIIELAALAGELVRETRAGRWVEAPAQRLPLALDLGKGELLFPGKLAQTIVEGGAASMRSLLEITAPPKITPIRPGATAMPLLCDRRSVPIDRLAWEPLLAAEVDTDDVPVIVYVEDHGGAIRWPFTSQPVPDPAHRARALANLAKEPVEITALPIPGGNRIVLVTGGFYAAESLLVPATMANVRTELGGPKVLFVGVPARGSLVAIDGERAALDEDLERAFLLLVEKHYLEAPERDRISSEVLLYLDGPAGRLESPLMAARRALRSAGVDPDA